MEERARERRRFKPLFPSVSICVHLWLNRELCQRTPMKPSDPCELSRPTLLIKEVDSTPNFIHYPLLHPLDGGEGGERRHFSFAPPTSNFA
jgi:hypothetical protein